MKKIAVILLFPVISLAGVPNSFESGTKAIAGQVNENFKYLDDKIESINSSFNENEYPTLDVNWVDKGSSVGDKFVMDETNYIITSFPFTEFESGFKYKVNIPMDTAHKVNSRVRFEYKEKLPFKPNGKVSGYDASIYYNISREYNFGYNLESTSFYTGIAYVKVNKTIVAIYFNKTYEDFKIENAYDNYDFTKVIDLNEMLLDEKFIMNFNEFIDYVDIGRL